MALEPGSILHGRYRIEGQLGKGGMGAVYLAFDQTLEIRVALKENLNLNPESERQFLREARLLAELRHPNLPRVINHFILEERQYLVMDYIEGEDLDSRAKGQPPTVDEVLAWAEDVCDALAYLHGREPPVIHRDIKPANLKLQPDGQVMLVDFGIAKVFDQAQTTTGARGLTPGYSPPEQYGGARTDARSDQYALAATVYTLLTGSRPADSIERMMDKAELKPARSLNPAVPEHVETALNVALSLDQDDRFPDITSFKAALHAKLDVATVVAGDRTVVAPKRRASFPLLLGVGVGGAVLIGGGVVVALAIALFNRNGEPGVTATLPSVALATGTGPPPATEALSLSPTATPSDTPEPVPTETPIPSPTPSPVRLGGGGKIAFASNREDGRTLQIWTMNPDGGDPLQLTFGPGNKTQPRWSPDGGRLLFVAPGGKDDFGNDLGLDIFVINADGSGVANLTRSPGDDSDPAWSPDGSQIAFASTRVNDIRQVFLMGVTCDSPPAGCVAQAGWPRNFSQGYSIEYSPAWSPDGAMIVVAGSVRGAPARIFLRELDAEKPEPRWFDRSDTILGVNHLRWSPDGTLLLFTWEQPGTNEIYIVPLDAPSTRVKLTNSAGNKEPAFSPDGEWIVFTSTRDMNPEIYQMTVNGANETNLTNSPSSRDLQPDWQPLP